MPSESKKQRPAPGSMYFPPPAAALSAPSASAQSPTSATSTSTTSSPRASSSSGGGASAATTSRALTPNKHLGELLRALEPRFCFHPAVEELLLDMATEFVHDVVGFAGRLAKHRRSVVLEPRDLQFCLAKNYGISLAGALPGSATGAGASAATAGPSAASAAVLQPLGQDLLLRARPAKNSLHMHRVALKRKALLRTKTKLLKAAGGGRKASDGAAAAAARKLVRKGSAGMDAK
ncbi:hypothetical protein PybrP1_011565 [[Pythium] brassicae (nom. inval.)]|nr:hypothetical protein PybrP1_011565 [[Pythium] brassicae (nom. inval.)]